MSWGEPRRARERRGDPTSNLATDWNPVAWDSIPQMQFYIPSTKLKRNHREKQGRARERQGDPTLKLATDWDPVTRDSLP